MTSTIKLIEDHLLKHGLNVYDQYETDGDEYLFYSDNMLILFDEKESKIKVSFQATARPEIVSRNLVILQRIPKLNIRILESFIFGQDNRILYGDEAFDLIKKSIELKAIKKYNDEMAYSTMLMSSECYEC